MPKPIQVQVAIVPIVAITSSKNSKAGKEAEIYPAQSSRTAFISFGPSSQVLQSPCGK